MYTSDFFFKTYNYSGELNPQHLFLGQMTFL